jgi:hypothetical protein
VIVFSLLLSVQCLLAPVQTPVAFPYVEPPCEFCAGRRTIDFAQSVGQVVVAPIAGRITFVGTVVDQGYVTIDPSPGTRYGPEVLITVGGLVIATNIVSGRNVQVGERIGVSNGLIRLSMRSIREGKAARYVDPTAYLGRRRPRVRLIPNSGFGARRAQIGLTCPASFGR